MKKSGPIEGATIHEAFLGKPIEADHERVALLPFHPLRKGLILGRDASGAIVGATAPGPHTQGGANSGAGRQRNHFQAGHRSQPEVATRLTYMG